MAKKQLLLITAAFVLVLSVGLAAQPLLSFAQGARPREQMQLGTSGPQAALGTRAALGSAFTYQGRLRDDSGNPIDSTCDLTFGLWDAQVGGSQVGSDSVVTGVSVDDGYFSAIVNQGGEFGSDAFAGETRWLEITLQCTGDPDPITLSPRQALNAAPYAHYSMGAPWSGLTGVPDLQLRVTGTCDAGNAIRIINANGSVMCQEIPVDHWGESWTGTGTGLTLSGGDIGLSANGSTYGVYGQSDATSGRGLYGYASASTGGNHGVHGIADSTDGSGVWGEATSTTGYAYGVRAMSASTYGRGVYATADATTGEAFGVYGRTASDEGRGVYGRANSLTGETYGVYGLARSPEGTGVYGRAWTYTGSGYGVRGEVNSPSGYAVYGHADSTTGFTYGVYGWSESPNGIGAYGWASSPTGTTYAVYGRNHSTGGYGVWGQATSTSGVNFGVYGQTSSDNGYGGYFYGDVHVAGDLSASGSKPFKIDHPLDPANQYLYHYSMESSEVLNQYSGNVILDENGEAWVELPAWFETLNSDFRYQLTCVGAYAPVYIAQEIEGGRFQIAGGPGGLKISWQVTALRSDPYIERYGAPVEMEKPEGEKGTYIFPELYDQPEELSLNYRHHQAILEQAP
jgi:hypothetical protein